MDQNKIRNVFSISVRVHKATDNSSGLVPVAGGVAAAGAGGAGAGVAAGVAAAAAAVPVKKNSIVGNENMSMGRYFKIGGRWVTKGRTKRGEIYCFYLLSGEKKKKYREKVHMVQSVSLQFRANGETD